MSDQSCTITDNDGVSVTIECPDGTAATVSRRVTDAGNSDIRRSNGEFDQSMDVTSACDSASDGEKLILEGSYIIRNTEDVAALAPYSSVTGDLLVSAAGMTALNLPGLCHVGGRAVFSGSSTLESVSLPDLVSVTGSIELNGITSLVNLQMPALQSVGALSIEQSQLSEFNFESLIAVNMLLDVELNNSLTVFRAPNLERIGEHLIVKNNPSLTGFDLSRLRTVGTKVAVHNNPALPNCLVEALLEQIAEPVSTEIHCNDNEASCE